MATFFTAAILTCLTFIDAEVPTILRCVAPVVRFRRDPTATSRRAALLNELSVIAVGHITVITDAFPGDTSTALLRKRDADSGATRLFLIAGATGAAAPIATALLTQTVRLTDRRDALTGTVTGILASTRTAGAAAPIRSALLTTARG